MKIEKTYWNQKGKHQAAVSALQLLVPDEGSVKNPAKNKQLEKFRRACNAYYKLYNDGCKRNIQRVFGLSMYDRDLHEKVEQAMDEIVSAAAIEQNI